MNQNSIYSSDISVLNDFKTIIKDIVNIFPVAFHSIVTLTEKNQTIILKIILVKNNCDY